MAAVAGLAATVALAAAAAGWLVSRAPSPSASARAPRPLARTIPAEQVQAAAGDLEKHLQGDPTDAHLAAALAAVQRDPEDVDALLTVGYLYVQRREYAKAKGYYLRASQVDPRNLEARTHLGTVAYFLGDIYEALHHYRQVLAMDPDYKMALFEMGAALRYGKHDLPAAVAAWEHWLTLDPEAPEADQVRKLVAEARRMIEDGSAPEPLPDEPPPAAPPPPVPDPDTAPWPGETDAAPGARGGAG